MKQAILAFGYGRNLFSKEDPERHRLAECAEYTDGFHMIVFSRAVDGCPQESVHQKLYLYSTSSHTALLYIFDAVRIALRIVRQHKQVRFTLTAQDPLGSGIACYIAHLITGLPFVVQEHGDIFSGEWQRESIRNRVWLRIARFLICRADKVRVVSDRVARHVHMNGVSRERTVVLPVFTDIQTFTHSTIQTNARSFFSPESRVILSVARFVPQKNLTMLLSVFARVYQSVPTARLLLVGSGPLRQEMEREIARHGVAEVTHVLPWSLDVSSLMKTSDLYLLTSNYEGWARVLVEAMACGLPAVSTEVGCVGQVFVSGVHGESVPVGAGEQCASQIIHMLSDDVLRERYAQNGIRDSVSIFPRFSEYAELWKDAHTV